MPVIDMKNVCVICGKPLVPSKSALLKDHIFCEECSKRLYKTLYGEGRNRGTDREIEKIAKAY